MKAIVCAIAAFISVSAGASTVDEMLDFGDKFRAKYGNELKGKTESGKPCVLTSWDKSWKGQAQDNRKDSPTYGQVIEVDERSAYMSLGANQAGAGLLSQLLGVMNWIGFSINPGVSHVGAYEVKFLEVTHNMVHMNVAAEEVVGSAGDPLKSVQNDIVITLGEKGEVVSAIGTSSYFPTITCKFDVSN